MDYSKFKPMKPFKPLLAYNQQYDIATLTYPLYGSPKVDGIRAAVVDGKLLSRSLKDIPNHHIRTTLSQPEFNSLDGELVSGDPTSPTCYRDSVGDVMREAGVKPFTYYVFDDFTQSEAVFSVRLNALQMRVEALGGKVDIRVLEQVLVHNEAELLALESIVLGMGYEGLILRSPKSVYKFGRSTFANAAALKLKRMSMDEAVILSVTELQTNMNESFTNELGRTSRSSHQENKVGAGTMGAITVKDLKTGVEFSIGTGFSAVERAEFWATRDTVVGKVVSYSHFPIGAYSAPRFPSYRGFRAAIDMSE